MKRGLFYRWGLGLGVLLQITLISTASARHRRHYPLPPTPTNSSYDQAPQCLDQNGDPLDVNNGQVEQWKTSTSNNYLNRAHVTGTVFADYQDQTGHAHFGIELSGSNDTLEVVYDLGFGPIPEINVGDGIEACGDYITAYAQSGHYPPSPDGALIHWIHKSDNPAKHEDGFLMINGSLYGQELPND